MHILFNLSQVLTVFLSFQHFLDILAIPEGSPKPHFWRHHHHRITSNLYNLFSG